jgi:hypothetical protein
MLGEEKFEILQPYTPIDAQFPSYFCHAPCSRTDVTLFGHLQLPGLTLTMWLDPNNVV